MKGRFAARAGRQIHYQTQGDTGAPAVFLVPGLGGGAATFGTLPRRFGRTGFHCLTADPIGIPPSGPLTGPFCFEQAAHDLFAVLDELSIERAAIVGTSLGGKVALTAAALQPERVTRLVMLASSAITTPRARRIYRFFEVCAAGLRPAEFADAVAPFLFGKTFQSERSAVVDDIVRSTRPGDAVRQLMQKQGHALRSFDGLSYADSLPTPTLCIAGREDTLTGVDEVRATAQAIPRGTFLEIPNAGHTLLLESAEVFDAVAAFCRG